jgi:hypothetical protein
MESDSGFDIEDICKLWNWQMIGGWPITLDEAYKVYAESLCKNVKELTDVEKKTGATKSCITGE